MLQDDEPARILVVDPERHAARLLEYVLKGQGYEVCCVGDGRRAVAAADEFDPQAVIVELRLPDMDGYELIRTLKRSRPETKAVAMTTRARSDSFASFDLRLMADACCCKPIGSGSLLGILADIGVPPTVCRLGVETEASP